MTQHHSSRARAALTTLAEEDPALGALALWCEHRDGDATRTRGTTITYGPDFAALPRHEQVGLAAHHILHVALRHPARLADLQGRYGMACDADIFNLAADALVNTVLEGADHALPRPAVTLASLKAEGLPLATDLADWDVERLYFALMPRDGSGSDRDDTDCVRAYARRQGFKADLDPEDAADGDAAAEAARWRQHLSRAADAGRAAGRGIGAALHRLTDLPDPQTPWNVILRRLLSRAVMQERQPATIRPARRWIATVAEAQRRGTPQPAFQPGHAAQTQVPRVVVAIDASGSIDDARLALFWAEVTGIARRLTIELHLVVFDDAIRHTARIAPQDTRLSLPDMPRGGGTAFAPVILHARSLMASALVILTDLDGDPGPAPPLPVVWAVPDGHATIAPFGQLIDLSR
ncbi:DUF2201 family putative metallopeptidase [Loktanella sp. DJP18]|uniref:vWA domain-containing protein n=1 Tax=Loktanella sp. DJP18 TaxID=3409788 RepID=UPI003BB5BBEF